MRTYSEQDLDQIERGHPGGLSAGEVVAQLDRLGVAFSEASLRKWVQFELLPRSVRVGHKGQQRGSQGQYPATIVRRILEVKALLGNGYSIEQIRSGFLLMRSEIETLEQQIGEVLGRAEHALAGDELAVEHLRRELRDARAMGEELVSRLRVVEARLGAARRKATRAAS